VRTSTGAWLGVITLHTNCRNGRAAGYTVHLQLGPGARPRPPSGLADRYWHEGLERSGYTVVCRFLQ
jgi:hypothetical protein